MTKKIAKRPRFILYIMALLLGVSFWVFAAPTADSARAAALIEIRGAIGPAVQDYISRGFEQAAESKASLVILQVDTPGGLAKSMRQIIQTMLNAPMPVVVFVAPRGARAASAGTYILYAAQIAAMAPGTNIGAATPVQIGSPGMTPPKSDKGKDKDKSDKKKLSASEKKALNDARAYIRSLAQLRGRNVKWAEKAVLEGESLSANEALKFNVINVIAKDLPELLQKINGKTVKVKGIDVKLNTSNLKINQIRPDWRSKFLSVITDPSVAYILLMIGVYGIFFEFVNPGFVAPGVIGGICLLIGLYALALLPVNYAGLALLLLGIGFIIAEAFVPSFGILGIGGAVSFIVGSIFLLKTDYAGFQLPIYTIISVAVVTLVFMLLILGMAIRSRKRPTVSGIEVLLGKQAVVQKDKNGKLWVRLEGEMWQCRSDEQIQEGQRVKVDKIEGLTLIVKSIKNEE